MTAAVSLRPPRRPVRNYRFAASAVIPAYLLVAGIAFADGTSVTSPQIVIGAVYAVVMQAAALFAPDRLLERLVTPLLVGATVAVAVIMTVFEGDRVLLAAPIVGLLAIGVPFLVDGGAEVVVTLAAALAMSFGLVFAQVDPGTVVVYVALFAVLWAVVSAMSRQQRNVLAEEYGARQEARQLADLLVAASTLNETEPAAVVTRVSEAGRSLGFQAVGVLRPVGEDLEGMMGSIPPRVLLDAIGRYEQDPDGDGRVARYELSDGRQAVVGQLRARGRVFGTVVAVASETEVLTSARVRTFSALLQLAAQAMDGANRYGDQRRAVRRLMELDAAKLDFISNVSHELRTPLTVIKGLGQTLTGGRVEIRSSAGHQLIGRLAANAERLGRMVTNLLDMSRLYQEGVRVDLSPVPLADVVRAVADRLETLSLDHEIRCEVLAEPTALADAVLLEHVLENLISNAVKHTPRGTHVSVRLEERRDLAVIRVSDDGPGIPVAELPRLTERFFRGGDPMTRETSGLGLGLALVADILLAHGTRLHVESGEGQGAEFSFSLEVLADGVAIEGHMRSISELSSAPTSTESPET
jgi:signal transduction histidine kinase